MVAFLALRKLLVPSLLTCSLLVPSSSMATSTNGSASPVVDDETDDVQLARRKFTIIPGFRAGLTARMAGAAPGLMRRITDRMVDKAATAGSR